MQRPTLNEPTIVQQGLQRLRDTFPLQTRIAHLAPSIRVAYVAVLSHWVQTGCEGTLCAAPPAALQALAAIDAIVINRHGVGCYPFSARDTGIQVTFGARQVHAMCAIDALAIPPLMQCAGQVTAACAACGHALVIVMDAEGNVTPLTTDIDVVWHHRHTLHACCGDSLCTDIRFVCRSCATPLHSTRFTVTDAAAIGNAFFVFQRELLAASSLD